MAEVNPPFALQNAGATHTAENDRTAIGAIMAGAFPVGTLTSRGGVHPLLGGAFAVTPNTGLILNVASGVAFIPGTESAKQGTYICTNDATKTVTLDTAHGTLPRIDRVILRVYDSAYSGASNTWAIEKLTGTAAASPVAPTLPANAIAIASVSVVANDTTISAGEITDTRSYATAVGGAIPVKSTGKPSLASVPDGQLIVLTDTGEIQAKIAGGWVTKSYTPTLINRQVFTASGTWTKPTNAKSVFVQVQGGGGAGGGSATTGAGESSMGSGGGGGAYGDGIFDAAALGATVTVTIGSGGTTVSGGDGNNGNTSSFGSHITASGGSGGLMRGVSFADHGREGGIGGSTITGAQLSIQGGPGQACFGGGQLGVSGEGGASYLGGGARCVRTTTAAQRIAGVAGTLYGSGGSGGICSGGAAAINGGAGAAGVVIVTTYF